MKKILLYCLLLTLLHNAKGQECTFENIYPYYSSQEDEILKTQNNDFIFITSACYDTTNRKCAGGGFYNQLLCTDLCGKTKWTNTIKLTYGSNSVDGIVETISQDIIMVGTNGNFSGMRVIKVDKNGNLLLEKRILTNIPEVYVNCIIKLSNNTFLVSGNVRYYQGNNSLTPFAMQIDENGNILRYKEYLQKFKWTTPTTNSLSPNTRTRFIRKLNDTSYFLVAQVLDRHTDSTVSTFPKDYFDLAVVFLDTGLNITHYYNLTDLVADSIRPHITYHFGFDYIIPVNDTIIFINGRNIFKDYPNTSNTTNSALLSVNEKKIISRTKEDLQPLYFRKDGASLYWNYNDSNFIIRDANLNIIKTIRTTHPQKLYYKYWAANLTDDLSIVAMGGTRYRKIKVSPEDSAFHRSEYANEVYIIKIDSNGYFTPTTWNSLQEMQQEKETLNIYPNPASNVLHIESAPNAEISIIDLRGKVIKQYFGKLNNQNKTEIDVSDLPQGVYTIKILADDKVLMSKFVKQ